MNDTTVEEGLRTIANLLDICDQDWFIIDEKLKKNSIAILALSWTISGDNPLKTTAILLNALKTHIENGKRSWPSTFGV